MYVALSEWKSFPSRTRECPDIGDYWLENSICKNLNSRFCSSPKQGPIISESNSMLIWAYNEKVRIKQIRQVPCQYCDHDRIVFFMFVINSYCYWRKNKNTWWEWEWESSSNRIIHSVFPETEPTIHSLSKVFSFFFTIFFNFLSESRRFLLSFRCECPRWSVCTSK